MTFFSKMSLIIFLLKVSPVSTTGLGQEPGHGEGSREQRGGWASCPLILLHQGSAVTKAEGDRMELCLHLHHRQAAPATLWSSALRPKPPLQVRLVSCRLLGYSPCTQHDCGCQGILEKSRFGTEFHQFLIERAKLGHFEEFYGLLQHVHKIPNVDILLGYTDIQGYLLSINKDDNYHITASTTNLLLRIFTQKKRKKQTVPLVQTC